MYLESGRHRDEWTDNAGDISHRRLRQSHHCLERHRRRGDDHETNLHRRRTAALRHPLSHRGPGTAGRTYSTRRGSCDCRRCGRSLDPCQDTVCTSSLRGTCCCRSHSGNSSWYRAQSAGDRRGMLDCTRGRCRPARRLPGCIPYTHIMPVAARNPIKHNTIHCRTRSMLEPLCQVANPSDSKTTIMHQVICSKEGSTNCKLCHKKYSSLFLYSVQEQNYSWQRRIVFIIVFCWCFNPAFIAAILNIRIVWIPNF